MQYTLDGLDAVSSSLDSLPVSFDSPLWASDYLHGFIVYGQSLSTGAHSDPPISVTQFYSNQTFQAGPACARAGNIFGGTPVGTATLIPLVEVVQETPCSYAANTAVELAAVENGVDPFDFPILASAPGHGGYSIAQLDKGSAWYQNIIDHVQQATQISAFCYSRYVVDAVAWIQGESDVPISTTQAAYYAALTAFQSDFSDDAVAITGQPGPIPLLIYQELAANKIRANVSLAQIQAVSDTINFVTPIYHLPHYSDGIHLTNVGSAWLGAYMGRAFKQRVIDNRVPDCLWPISATVRDTVLTVMFRVPTSPLVIDITTLASTQDAGFAVFDDGGQISIDNVVSDGEQGATVTLARAPTTNPYVRYGLNYTGTGLVLDDGGSGNVRDSTTLTTSISGSDYPLWHVAPAFELPIIILAP